MHSDEDLALGVQRGRTDDLVLLFERHYDPLVGYLYRLTGGQRALAEDQVQETFLRVLRAIRQYAYPRPFKPWLYAIATNLARNHYRAAETRHTRLAGDDESSDGDDTVGCEPAGTAGEIEDLLVHNDALRVAAALLNALPAPQREVMLLRYLQELSLTEIAQALDVPLGTVKSRLSLALRRLRAMVEAGVRVGVEKEPA